MTKILMSRDNPHGWKLEELLAIMQRELAVKTQLIKGDGRPPALHLLRNNQQILGLLAHAEALQRDSCDVLDAFAPDPGPEGRPRVGAGSDDQPDMLNR